MDPIKDLMTDIKKLVDQRKEAIFETDIKWSKISGPYQNILMEIKRDLVWYLTEKGFGDAQIYVKTNISYSVIGQLTRDYWAHKMEQKEDGKTNL